MIYDAGDRELRVQVRQANGNVVEDDMSFMSHFAQCEHVARKWLNAKYITLPDKEAALVEITQQGEAGELPSVPERIDDPTDLQDYFADLTTAQAARAEKQKDIDEVQTLIKELKEELRWLLAMKDEHGKQPWLIVTWNGNRKAIGVYPADVIEQDYVEGMTLPVI